MTKGAKLLKIYRVTNDLTQQDFSKKSRKSLQNKN